MRVFSERHKPVQCRTTFPVVLGQHAAIKQIVTRARLRFLVGVESKSLKVFPERVEIDIANFGRGYRLLFGIANAHTALPTAFRFVAARLNSVW